MTLALPKLGSLDLKMAGGGGGGGGCWLSSRMQLFKGICGNVVDNYVTFECLGHFVRKPRCGKWFNQPFVSCYTPHVDGIFKLWSRYHN